MDRWTEFRRGIGKKVEVAKSGLDQFLHDERGSARFSWRHNVYVQLGIVVAGAFVGGLGVGELAMLTAWYLNGGFDLYSTHDLAVFWGSSIPGLFVGMFAGMFVGTKIANRLAA